MSRKDPRQRYQVDAPREFADRGSFRLTVIAGSENEATETAEQVFTQHFGEKPTAPFVITLLNK